MTALPEPHQQYRTPEASGPPPTLAAGGLHSQSHLSPPARAIGPGQDAAEYLSHPFWSLVRSSPCASSLTFVQPDPVAPPTGQRLEGQPTEQTCRFEGWFLRSSSVD